MAEDLFFSVPVCLCLFQAAREGDAVIVFANDALSGHVLNDTPPQMLFARKLASGMRGRVAVVGTGTPYEAAFIREIPYIAAYSYRHDALLASVGVLAGAVRARGRQPVKI